MTWRAVLTVAGQAIGASFGPIGAAIGAAIGGAVGGAIDGPMESSQALLEDLDAIKFDYGSTWPRMYGRYRHKVSPIWSSTKRPVASVEEGGDCLSGTTEQTTYTYAQDWLCWAPLNAIGFCRVWINGELKYSTLVESDADTLTASLETTAWAAVTFFDGNAAQLPWPIYEAAVGTVNASAYRYRPTLAFESLDLGNSGQPPLVEVDFFTAATSEVGGGGVEVFSLWQATSDWGPLYGSPSGYIYETAEDAMRASQASYEADWGPLSRGDYSLHLPPATVSPLGEPQSYYFDVETGGTTQFAGCTAGRLYQGVSGQIPVYTPTPADLADIVSSENLLTWSSETGALTATDIDVSALVGTEVTGYATTGSPRESTAQLMDVFYFGAVCSNKLYYRFRGAAAVDTIVFDETGSGVGEASEPFTGMERGNDLEVASQVALTGPNILWDYEPGTEHSDLLVSESFELRRYQTPVVFTPAQRKGRADTMVHDGRIASHTAMVSLDDRHVELEPFDVWLQLDDEGNSYRVRAERETYSDSGRAFDVVLDDASILSSSGLTVATDSRTITIALPDDTVIELLDIPILRDADNDPGFYAVAKGSTAGSVLYSSLNAVAYTQEASFAAESVFGTATTTLGNWTGGRVFDEKNNVTVNVGEGTLTSSTRTLLLADQSVNAFALGVHGRYELGQFRTATFVSAGVYTLTGLLRGSRGTDWASTGHTGGETFVLITGAGRRVEVQTSELGVSQYYKGVSVGRSLASATAETFTNNGVGLKPFSPVHVRVARDASNDATITFQRRTRMSTRLASSLGISAPLGETTESYSVDVYSTSGYTTIVSTLASTTTSVSFTAAQQTAAGLTPGATLYLRVYQIGSVGRGYAAEKAA